MQINGKIYFQNLPQKQNFKGNSANFDTSSSSSPYQPVPLETSKAYASSQIIKSYRDIETFNLPYIGDGKLYELSNGHKIILVPKMGQTLIHTCVGVGENNEPANLKQLSHLLEHLVDNYCSNPKTNETNDILSKLAADSNAYNSEYSTGYHINALVNNSEDFENLVKIQAQTLRNKDFTDKELEIEKKTIIQELDSRKRFAPNHLLANKFTIQNLFNLKDSSDILALSNISTINNVKKEDLVDYYNTFYRPDNMVTTVIGNVDGNSIKTIAKYFNNIQKPQEPPKNINYPQIHTDNLIQKTVRKDIQSLDKDDRTAYIDLAFIGPKSNDINENILIDTLSWVINERVKDSPANKEHLFDISATSDNIIADKTLSSIFRLHGRCHTDDVEDNLKNIYSILYDLTENPTSEEELQLVKDKSKSDWTNYVEDSFLLSYMLSRQGLLSKNLDIEKEQRIIDSITPQDIQNTAQKYIDLNKVSLVVIHPQDKTEKTNAVSFHGNIDSIDTKDIHEYVLPNNLRVIIDSRPGIARSTVKFELNSKKMLYVNPEAASCLVNLLTSEKTQQEMEKQDISYDYNATSQHIFSILNGSADKTLKMLEFSEGIILHPDLDEKKFNERQKNLVDNDSPPKIYIQDKIGKEFFNDYACLSSKENIKNLELEDVKSLHQQILKNAQGTVFITIPQEELKKNQDEIFQTLMKIPMLQPYDYNAIYNKYKSLPLDENRVFVEKNDSDQIEVKKIFKIVESGNIKDRAGLLLLNQILGGDEKSKLVDKLRNQDNIVYSAASNFYADFKEKDLAELNLSTTVSANNKDNLRTVISEFDNSIDELTSKPISQEELNRAKSKVKSLYLKSLENSSDRNAVVSNNYDSFYGINYQKALFDAIDNITSENIQQLAKYYLTQPCLIAVSGNEEAINTNKEYLSSLSKGKEV